MTQIGNVTDKLETELNLFAEPFTELWKKLLGTAAFMLNSIGCVIMLTFVGLERQGFGSYYRTALNQLNSWVLIFVSQEVKVEKILKGSLDSIPSPLPSVKIQIMGGKVCLRCKGKTLLGVVNKRLKTKCLLTSPSIFLPITSSKLFRQ